MRSKKINYLEILKAICIFLIVFSFLFIKDRFVSALVCTIGSFALLSITYISFRKNTSKSKLALINLVLSGFAFVLFFISMIQVR